MDWNFQFDDEMGEINCFNGLFIYHFDHLLQVLKKSL